MTGSVAPRGDPPRRSGSGPLPPPGRAAHRILVTGDTHAHPLPGALRDAAAGADLILHTGDFVRPEALDELRLAAPVYAVAGNCDPAVAGLPERRVVAAGELRIGLTHGHLGRGASTPARARGAFAPGEVDVVVFGHSHQPLVEWLGGLLLLNPGSPTERRRAPAHTYAWLTVDPGGRPQAWLVELRER